MTKLRNGAHAFKGWKTKRDRRAAALVGLRYARKVLAEDRRDTFDSFVVHGTPDTPDAYTAMDAGERKILRRIDRAIAGIDAALKIV